MYQEESLNKILKKYSLKELAALIEKDGAHSLDNSVDQLVENELKEKLKGLNLSERMALAEKNEGKL